MHADEEHLHFLAEIARCFQEESIRSSLRQASSVEELYERLNSASP
jgi:mannitol/fructose-specific phosphotransferase system IIA component (Ntr-type)